MVSSSRHLTFHQTLIIQHLLTFGRQERTLTTTCPVGNLTFPPTFDGIPLTSITDRSTTRILTYFGRSLNLCSPKRTRYKRTLIVCSPVPPFQKTTPNRRPLDDVLHIYLQEREQFELDNGLDYATLSARVSRAERGREGGKICCGVTRRDWTATIRD